MSDDEPVQITASEVLRRQEEWAKNTTPKQRVAMAKMAILKGDTNALDALGDLALRGMSDRKTLESVRDATKTGNLGLVIFTLDQALGLEPNPRCQHCGKIL